MQIRIVTWNIWGGRRLKDVAAFLKDANADVVGLQEVWEIRKNEKVINQAAKLAEGMDYSYSFCPAFVFKTAGYTQGNAILSRYPIKGGACHLLSEESLYKRNAETEPRTAGEALIELPNGRELRILNVHLAFSHGLRPSKIRDIQMHNLLPLLKTPHTILMGDFNVLPESPEIKNLNEIMKNADPVPIAPSWKRFRMASRLDHIFISKDLSETSCTIGASRASDHFPVIAEIELGE